MLEAGDKVGEYTLIKYLGSGVSGEVWLAEKPIQFADKGVLRALKFLSGKAGKGVDIGNFRREIHAWIEASGHPNVVSVFDAFVNSGRFVIVSEYVRGGSLRDWLDNNGNKASSIKKAVEMMSGILNGLVHLHSLNITHRDLKPNNILLHHETPQIADFGMSRIVESATLSNTRAGSPPYMSPEAFKKSKNPQTDVWSAGVIFYEMLSGEFPFHGEDLFSWMEAVKSDNPKSLPTEVPEELRKIVERALQKEPLQRFQTADEMRLELNKTHLSPQPKVIRLSDTILDKEFLAQSSKLQFLIPYRKGDKWGFCDLQKNILIEPRFDFIYPFRE